MCHHYTVIVCGTNTCQQPEYRARFDKKLPLLLPSHWERPWHRTPTWKGQSQSEPWSRPPETTNQNHHHIYFIQSEFITGPTNNHFLSFIFECRNPVLNFKTSTNKKNIRLKVLKSKKKKWNQYKSTMVTGVRSKWETRQQ